MAQTKYLTALLLFCLFPVLVLGGFVHPISFVGSKIRTTNGHAFYVTTTRRGVDDINDDDREGAGSRRDLLQSCASVAFLTAGGKSAMAEAATGEPSTDEDLMFEQFAKSLHNSSGSSVTTSNTEPQRWPASPSPLPTAKKNAAELTMPDSPSTLTLEDAMKEASKKKNVGPRTHG